MQRVSRRRAISWAFVLVGIFGVAFAIDGLFVALPAPAVGGTCGPGKLSESAVKAFFDPSSIGAGREPAATSATNITHRADWMAFVGECQASADSRVLSIFAVFVLSVVVALGGAWSVARVSRTPPVSPPVGVGELVS